MRRPMLPCRENRQDLAIFWCWTAKRAMVKVPPKNGQSWLGARDGEIWGMLWMLYTEGNAPFQADSCWFCYHYDERPAVVLCFHSGLVDHRNCLLQWVIYHHTMMKLSFGPKQPEKHHSPLIIFKKKNVIVMMWEWYGHHSSDQSGPSQAFWWRKSWQRWKPSSMKVRYNAKFPNFLWRPGIVAYETDKPN